MQKYRAPEIKVKVLGVKFQAFTDPGISQTIFSQRGSARALKIPARSLRRILASDEFKCLRGNDLPWGRLDTEVSSKPISVITQTDLVLLVQIAADKGYSVAKSMQEASFAVLLQQSVDQALGTERPIQEYLDKGASLQQQLEYLHSYHALKRAVLTRRHGVRGLCTINRQVSKLAVSDSDLRRIRTPAWRKWCSDDEKLRLTIGNAIGEKAANASFGHQALNVNLELAAQRTTEIYKILDAPF